MNLTVFADHDLKHHLAGGANVNLEENLRRLASKHKIRLLCTWEKGLAEHEVADGIEIFRFKGNQITLRWIIPRYFKKHLEADTDVVWDEVDSSVPWLTPFFSKKPILMHCLHFQKSNFFYELPKWLAAIAYILEPLLYGLYKNHTALAISESTRDCLLDIGFSPEKVKIVTPALNSSVFKPESEILAKKSKTPLIVSLSRLRAWKGVHFSIQAMKEITAQIPEAQLAIIGTGPYESELKKLASKLGLDRNIQFLGRISEEEKMEWVSRAHILTKTSGREGWGIDVIEANACLTPAVGWRVDGTKDSIQDQKTGFLIPFGDISALAQTVIRLLKDIPLRNKMGKDARKFCENLTWELSASQIEEILYNTCQNPNGS